MTGGKLILNSLRFHLRSHLGVLLGATLAAAILVGALAVGDSVRYSLREMALSRLGNIHLALNGQTRFFRTELAEAIAREQNLPVAPIVLLRGTATGQKQGDDGKGIRAGRVQVVGVTGAFWKLGGTQSPLDTTKEGIVLNDRLARTLGVQVGDDVLLRVDKPSLLSRDAPLSTVSDATVSLRLPLTAIVNDSQFGRFSLDANQIPPLTAFLPIELLQNRIAMPGRANILLVGANGEKSPAPDLLTSALWKHWQFADAALEMHELPGRNLLELHTDRVFLDPPVAEAALKGMSEPQGVFTYFVNELRVGEKTTPYSTVAAMQGGPVPADMQDDEVLVNQWFADDVQARVGDSLKLTYWVVGPMRRLVEQRSTFRIRAILPMEGAANDPDLMPQIPGLADKKNCRDWEPGVPIDTEKLRDKDQDYWNKFRGSPKAFLSLRAGQKIWENRFGNLTAVRYPLQGQTQASIEACIRQALSPASLGLFFTPVREQALAASSQSLDFGQLFLGFSSFLIIAALLLTALLFGLGVEQRSEEVGTLLAIGFSPKRVQRLLLLEGGLIALVAAVLGAISGIFYTQVVVRGLSGVWSGAVAGAALRYHAEPKTLLVGAIASFLVAVFTIWLVARRQARVPARILLSIGAEAEARLADTGKKRAKSPGLLTALLGTIGALVLVGMALTQKQETAAETFFSAGGLLLIGGLGFCRLLLASMERGAAEKRLTIGSLGMRSSARRWGRSLSAASLLACGSFLVVAVGASRHDATQGAKERGSGTGGFSLYGEAALPVYDDLNTPQGREVFGLDAEQMEGVNIVAMRLREGDEASCLNLNRAQVPRLLGVSPETLAKRGAFAFGKTLTKTDAPWNLLDAPDKDGAIPVIGDNNTIVWSLGKSLGDIVPYVDDRGQTLKLRIVGILGNSVLQGSLLLSEAHFIRLFPTQSGYQVFLIDTAPTPDNVNRTLVAKNLSSALENVGLTLTPTTERLAAFNMVENTYLSIFAILGGLGLLLGSAGLGVIVLRNVLERRGELALLRAVGFRSGALHWLVFSEHVLLLGMGLLVGIVAAIVAVLPAMRTPGAGVPWLSLSLTLFAVLVSGFVWTWAATSLALRGSLLTALRNE